jgi:hypothetical protein
MHNRTESAAIDESTLLDRLRQHALGMAEMTSTQVRAAELLLKKAKAADEAENHAVRATISAEPLSEEEWARTHVR